jgi:hypothetical protein
MNLTPQSAPRDLDALLSVDEFLAWTGKTPDARTRRWAKWSAVNKRIPAVKMGRDWLFHPRTVLATLTTGGKPCFS